MKSFRKLLYLPSGGLSYPPFAWLYPITNEVGLYQADPQAYDSMFDYYLGIMERYCEIQVPTMELYTQDVYYIWLYFLLTDLLKHGNYYLKTRCRYCNQEVSIMVDLGNLDITIRNRFTADSNKFQASMKHLTEDYIFEYGYRRVKHNVEFGNLQLNSEMADNDIYMASLYIASQLDNVTVLRGGKVDTSDYMGLLMNLRFHELLDLFDEMIACEDHFGINNKMFYQCKQCEKVQTIRLFDNITNSTIAQEETKNILTRQENMFEGIFNLVRLPMMDYGDYLTIPVRFSLPISNVVSRMQFTPLL